MPTQSPKQNWAMHTGQHDISDPKLTPDLARSWNPAVPQLLVPEEIRSGGLEKPPWLRNQLHHTALYWRRKCADAPSVI